jgi:hypothetical protein
MPSLITRIRSGCGPFGTGLRAHSEWPRRGWYGAGGHYTKRRGNAHKTDKAEEREVLYPWHPWVGCVVLVHEVVEKADGVVLRCSRDGRVTGRWLELPAWMFDRAACLPMQVAHYPRVDFVALSALSALLAERVGCDGRVSSPNTPVSGSAREPCDQNPGDAHATPLPPSCEPSQTNSSARAVRSIRADRLQSADVANASRRDASGSDRPHGAASPRTRPRRSSGPDRGGR